MFKNFISVTFRNLIRQKIFSIITILGFSIGLAIFILISSLVIIDLTYDTFHKDIKNIYRVTTREDSEGDNQIVYGITSGPLVKSLKEDFPEVSHSVRIASMGSSFTREISNDDSPPEEIRAFLIGADPDFFEIFNFPIIQGNNENPLVDPHGVYITEEFSEKLFGEENPIGKPIYFIGYEDKFVAGVIKDLPLNTQIRFSVVYPIDLELNPIWWDSWTNAALSGYIKVIDNVNMQELKDKINVHSHENGFAKIWTAEFIPMKDMHLKSEHLSFNLMNVGHKDSASVYTSLLIAFLVLLIASFNYVNLTTAKAMRRAREVGVRKVIGGQRSQVMRQFLGESIVITYISTLFALVLLEIFIPILELPFKGIFELLAVNYLLIGTLIIPLVIGICAGLYPALIMSNFKPIIVLKGAFSKTKKGLALRKILVVGQFTITISLISALLIAGQHMKFLQKVDLGYNRENVYLISNINIPENREVFNDKIRSIPGVEYVASIGSLPGGTLQKYQIKTFAESGEKDGMYDRLIVDDNLIPALNMRIIKGRNFSRSLSTDTLRSIILNETAVKYAGWDDPIGKTVKLFNEDETTEEREVIGIVKDFNFTTVKREINPMFIVYDDRMYQTMVKLDGRNDEETLEKITSAHLELVPDGDLHVETFDQQFSYQFYRERNFSDQIRIFSIIAIIISCMGLLGLSAFMTEQRTKEIGIRKVMGATSKKIAFLLTKSFLKWVLIANVLAIPITWYAMSKWIDGFVYRSSINPIIFVLSGIIVVLIATFAVSFQTIRAANLNPVKSIKYE
ncbi:MAG: ABC transporter permease [Candidatus Cloacimonetes bacterium]|nr:ABC transporter permease [Candidatus Cloacimonadota bacterium]